MDQEHPLQMAVKLWGLGKLSEAISILERHLADNPSLPADEQEQTRVYLCALYRHHGDLSKAEAASCDLIGGHRTSPIWRAHAWIERSILRREEGNPAQAFQCLDRARELMNVRVSPGTDSELDKLHAHFHNTYGRLLYRQHRHQEALEEYLLATGFLASIDSKLLVNIQLNIANVLVVLGRKQQALRYLQLASASMKRLGPENAYGLGHFFEALATFNLFIFHSERKAIDTLMQISEEVIKDFDDFRKVFDFFSSIIVQRHEGQFDLDAIRRLVEDYGDDPLIKAFLPSLLTGCPPPGGSAGSDVEDEVGGGGGELENLEGEGEEEGGEELAEGEDDAGEHPPVWGDEDEEDEGGKGGEGR